MWNTLERDGEGYECNRTMTVRACQLLLRSNHRKLDKSRVPLSSTTQQRSDMV